MACPQHVGAYRGLGFLSAGAVAVSLLDKGGICKTGTLSFDCLVLWMGQPVPANLVTHNPTYV